MVENFLEAILISLKHALPIHIFYNGANFAGFSFCSQLIICIKFDPSKISANTVVIKKIYSRREKTVTFPSHAVPFKWKCVPVPFNKNGSGTGAKYGDKQYKRLHKLKLAQTRQLLSQRKPKRVLFQLICWFWRRSKSVSGTRLTVVKSAPMQLSSDHGACSQCSSKAQNTVAVYYSSQQVNVLAYTQVRLTPSILIEMEQRMAWNVFCSDRTEWNRNVTVFMMCTLQCHV